MAERHTIGLRFLAFPLYDLSFSILFAIVLQIFVYFGSLSDLRLVADFYSGISVGISAYFLRFEVLQLVLKKEIRFGNFYVCLVVLNLFLTPSILFYIFNSLDLTTLSTRQWWISASLYTVGMAKMLIGTLYAFLPYYLEKNNLL